VGVGYDRIGKDHCARPTHRDREGAIGGVRPNDVERRLLQVAYVGTLLYRR